MIRATLRIQIQMHLTTEVSLHSKVPNISGINYFKCMITPRTFLIICYMMAILNNVKPELDSTRKVGGSQVTYL